MRKDGWLMRLEILVYERLEWDREKQDLRTDGGMAKERVAQHLDQEEIPVDGVAV